MLNTVQLGNIRFGKIHPVKTDRSPSGLKAFTALVSGKADTGRYEKIMDPDGYVRLFFDSGLPQDDPLSFTLDRRNMGIRQPLRRDCTQEQIDQLAEFTLALRNASFADEAVNPTQDIISTFVQTAVQQGFTLTGHYMQVLGRLRIPALPTACR